MIAKLESDKTLMVNSDCTEVVPKPAPNQNCPCGSKLRYKKCGCAASDFSRTQEFITGATKEV